MLQFGKTKSGPKCWFNRDGWSYSKGTLASYEGHALLQQITRLIRRHEDVKVSHIFRETNKCADVLASEDCKLRYNSIYFSFAHNFLEFI